MTSALEIDRLTKVFRGGVEAVRGVDLRVEPGELVALVGPSGCGKTTVLRVVAGLERPTSGDVRVLGRVVTTTRPAARRVALVPQEDVLYPHLSAAGNIGLALRLRGMPRADRRRRIESAAAALDIAEQLARRPAGLSGGQRRRVALARALVREPAVFLFDEPLENLDPALRLAARREIRALHRRLDAAALYVTHDQAEAMAIADRLAVMHAGRLLQVGAPGEVYRRPACRFVAGFVGSPAMQFLPGRIHGPAFVESTPAADAWRVPLANPSGAAPGGVWLGVRQRAIRFDPNGPLHAVVDGSEPLGDETDVRVRTPAGHELTVRSPSAAAPPAGATVRVSVDPEGLHLFERGGEERRLS